MHAEPDSAVIVMVRPRFEANVAAALRAAACFNASELVIVARRYEPASGSKQQRVLRPLRMQAYQGVRVRFVEAYIPAPEFTPVAVERLRGSESLPFFPHPQKAVYMFGPEDGTLAAELLRCCHRFVSIPAAHCLNLGAAVYTVLYDRAAKAARGEGPH